MLKIIINVIFKISTVEKFANNQMFRIKIVLVPKISRALGSVCVFNIKSLAREYLQLLVG